MAESTLAIDYLELQRRVAFAQGLGRKTKAEVSAAEAANIDDFIRSGLRQFYYPPPLAEGQPPHQWSFLWKTATIPIGIGVSGVDLPDDMAANQVKDFSFSTPTGRKRLAVVSYEAIAAMRASAAAEVSGIPKYAAIRRRDPESTFASGATRYQLIVYPVPSQSIELVYRHLHAPEMLTDALPYPEGGPLHAETALASCLAAVERYLTDQRGIYWEAFKERLAASIAHDLENRETEPETWDISEVQPTTLGLLYDDLLREVGAMLGYGWNPNLWTEAQTSNARSVVDEGVRGFLYPAMPPGDNATWSFLTPEAEKPLWSTGTVLSASYSSAAGTTVVTANSEVFDEGMVDGPGSLVFGSTSYPIVEFISGSQIRVTGDASAQTGDFEVYGHYNFLMDDSDFAGISGPLTYTEQSYWTSVSRISEWQMREMHQRINVGTRPVAYALRPRAYNAGEPPKWELLLWPRPTTKWTVRYRKIVQPARLTYGEWAPGGIAHAQTVLCACRAAAEMRLSRPDGRWANAFRACLKASIEADRRLVYPDKFGYNADNSDNRRILTPRTRHPDTGTRITYNGSQIT